MNGVEPEAATDNADGPDRQPGPVVEDEGAEVFAEPGIRRGVILEDVVLDGLPGGQVFTLRGIGSVAVRVIPLRPVPDVFAGSEVLVAGGQRGSGEHKADVSGFLHGKSLVLLR